MFYLDGGDSLKKEGNIMIDYRTEGDFIFL